MIKLTLKSVALAVGLVMVSSAHAGRSCDQQPMTAQNLSQGLALAQRTAEALDAEFARTGARVVVVGRT